MGKKGKRGKEKKGEIGKNYDKSEKEWLDGVDKSISTQSINFGTFIVSGWFSLSFSNLIPMYCESF